MAWRAFFLLLGVPGAIAAADAVALEGALGNWLGEPDHWAFTQRAIEWEGGQPRERIERYDPSKAGDDRWTLLAINGVAPTSEQQAAWARKKFRWLKRPLRSPVGEYFDFKAARIVEETPVVARYEVPLRTDRRWLFEASKVQVIVTVNKDTGALERITAHVIEPVRVLLGLARILGGALDVSFLALEEGAPPRPGTVQPEGSAQASVVRFGRRAEFAWSEFSRVSRGPGGVTAVR